MNIFIFLLAFAISGSATAEMLSNSMSAGADLPKRPVAEYRISYFGNTEVSRQGIGISQLSNEVMVAYPFLAETDSWALKTTLHNSQITPGANLNGSALPNQLWNLSAGISYQHVMGDRKKWGSDLTLGSASDIPFHSISESSLQATAFLTVPQGEKDNWLFLLNFSNLRPFLNYIPLPAFAYVYQPSPELRLMLGLPLASILWRPDKWLAVAFISPFAANLQLGYAFLGPAQAFVSAYWTTQVFWLAGRSDSKEQFFHGYKTVNIGVRSPLARFLFAELSAGYAFSRSYYEGTSYFSYRGQSTDLASGLLGSGSIKCFL